MSPCARERWFLREDMGIYRKKKDISKHLPRAFYLFGSEPDWYELRLDGMIFKEEFTSNKEALEPNIRVLKKTTEDLLYSDLLPEILNVILQVGNFLNYGSHAGNAQGFKINALSKLTDTRANKPRMNLMHYIVQVVEKEKEELLTFPETVPDIDRACRLTIDYLEGEIKTMKKNVEKLQKGISKADENIKEQFEATIKSASADIESFEESCAEIRKLEEDFANYLCEDTKKFKLEEVFSIFKHFCDNIKTARKENEQFRIQEAKRLERERKKREQDAKKQNGVGGKIKTKIPDPLYAEETCIVDKLMDEIRNGFPLKKQRGSKPSTPAAFSPQSRRASRERARASFRRGSLLSLLAGISPKPSQQGSMESISENSEKEKRKIANGAISNSSIDPEELTRKVSKIDDASKEEVNGNLPNGTKDGEENMTEEVNGKEISSSIDEEKGVEESAGNVCDSNKVGTVSAEDIGVKAASEINGSEAGVNEGSCNIGGERDEDSPKVVVNGQQSLNEIMEINGVSDGTEDIAKADVNATNDKLVDINDVAIDVNGEISDVHVKGEVGQTENITENEDSLVPVLNGHRSEVDEPLYQDETFVNVESQPMVEPVHSAVNSSAGSDKEITNSPVPENEQKEHALDFSDTALLLTNGSPQEPTAVENGSHLHDELHEENSSDIEVIEDIEGKSVANNKNENHEEKVTKEVVKKIKSKKKVADGGKRDFEAIVSDSKEPDESDMTKKLLIDEEVNEPATSKMEETKGGKVRHNMCACYPRRKKNEQTRKCSVM